MTFVLDTPKVLPYSFQWIDQPDIDAVVDALTSDFVTQGPQIAAFEAALCAYVGVEYAVVVSSGTAALHLACAALKKGATFMGITSPITFAASSNCLLYNQSEVRFCDVSPETGLMDPEKLEEALSKIDKHCYPDGVIIPVSLNGQVADLEAIQAIAYQRGWKLIEDAAHSLGAIYSAQGKTALSGSCIHTDMAILSFHPLKHICCAEGGAVLTNDKMLAERVRLLRSHGIVRSSLESGKPEWFYEQIELGFNYRMTDIQAALGISQMKRLDFFLERRRTLAMRYKALLEEPFFQNFFRVVPQKSGSAYHLFVIHFYKKEWRNQAYTFLKEQGILTQVHYVPVYEHPYYKERLPEQFYPGAQHYYEGILSIPLAPKMTLLDQDRVIDSLTDFCKQI